MTRKLDQYRKIWLVGASKGIGAALVKALDAPDRHLLISARNTSELEALALQCQGQCTVLPLDICDTEALEKTARELRQSCVDSQPVDMVILNAGTCEYMDSDELDLALLERVMQTNFFAIVGLIKQALPLLRQAIVTGKPAPKLVIMSSSVTYQALPRAHAYGASKAALRYFSECLKTDIQKEGIDVRVVSPGFVKTPLTDKNDFDMPFLLEADEAAERIVAGLESKRFDIAFPRRFTCMLKLFSALPDGWRFRLLGKMSRHNPDPSVQTGSIHS